MVKIPVSSTNKVSKLETIKETSNFLREPLATQLLENSTHFTEQ